MTREEFKKRMEDFEFMMQEYHKGRFGNYGPGRASLLIGMLIDLFTRNKYKPVYEQLLKDLADLYDVLDKDEYFGWRKRIISAYEF